MSYVLLSKGNMTQACIRSFDTTYRMAMSSDVLNEEIEGLSSRCAIKALTSKEGLEAGFRLKTTFKSISIDVSSAEK